MRRRSPASHERYGEVTSFEAWVKVATLSLATGIDAVAGAVIATAVIRVVAVVLPATLRTDGGRTASMATRMALGNWLSVALELEVAADILRTAVTPTWSGIGQLGAIIALRTFLNYVLRMELSTGRNE